MIQRTMIQFIATKALASRRFCIRNFQLDIQKWCDGKLSYLRAKSTVNLALVLLVLFVIHLSGCAAIKESQRSSFYRLVSTHPNYTIRELEGEAKLALKDMGMRHVSGHKWRRGNEAMYLLLERDGVSPPTLDISVFVEPGMYAQKHSLNQEVSTALSAHFTRRMELNEVKLLKAFESQQPQ